MEVTPQHERNNPGKTHWTRKHDPTWERHREEAPGCRGATRKTAVQVGEASETHT